LRDMTNENTACSWSGGKDSCYAFMLAIQTGKKPKVLLNVLNEEGKISRSHGIPVAILQAQASAAGLPIHFISSTWAEYEKNYIETLKGLQKQYQLRYAVFGDIDVQSHKDWVEKVSGAAGMEAILPLWQQDSRKLVMDMLSSGIETMIVSCNETLGERFLGKILDHEVIKDLDALGVDVCGENGEFHTLVVNCPLFRQRIDVTVKNKLKHEKYWFSDLVLR
jgi:diphthine-ammonia ligase